MNKIAIIKDSGNLKSFKVIFFDTFQTLCWLSIKNNHIGFCEFTDACTVLVGCVDFKLVSPTNYAELVYIPCIFLLNGKYLLIPCN